MTKVEKFRVHIHDPPRRAAHIEWAKEEERIFMARMRGEEVGENCVEEPSKKVEWLELFFDLVFVATFANASELLVKALELQSNCTKHGDGGHGGRLLSEDHPSDDLWGLSQTSIMLLSYFYVALISFKIWAVENHLNSCVDGCNDLLGRFLTFMVMAAFSGMSANVELGIGNVVALQEFTRNFGGVYIWFTFKSFRVYRNAANAEMRRAWGYITCMFAAEGLALLLIGYLCNSSSTIILSCTFIVCLFYPLFSKITKTGSLIAAEMPVHPSHAAERFGLLVIIVLGEATVHAIKGSAIHFENVDKKAAFRATAVFGGLLAFIPILSMWWRYFDAYDERVGLFRVSSSCGDQTTSYLQQESGGVSACLGFLLEYAACNDLETTRVPRFAQNMTFAMMALSEFFMGFILIINLRRKQRDRGVFTWKRYRWYWAMLIFEITVLLLFNLVSFTPFGLLGYLSAHHIACVVVDVCAWHHVERSLHATEKLDTSIEVAVATPPTATPPSK